MNKVAEIIPHLFRTEYSKINAVLMHKFGFNNFELAEDITSDTFKQAMEIWPYKGLPEHPTAWLYAVAKNKALNVLKRQQHFNVINKELFENDLIASNIDLSEENIFDSQLKMLFVVCHPVLSSEAKISLALRVLCSFGIEEIATALLTNKETVNKRLFRAKQKLKEENIQIELPGRMVLDSRLENVLKIIYLIFNEGYYSESNNEIIREDLCLEAIRLNEMLLLNDFTNKPESRALLSLMYFHASRLKSRKGMNGQYILYQDQNEADWNQNLISKGMELLHSAAIGNKLTTYHLEASIAYWHTIKKDSVEKWESILKLYNQLLQISYSPMAALNRVFALYKVHGADLAIDEAEKLNKTNSQFYFVLLGELYKEKDLNYAVILFQKALKMTKNESEKAIINRKINEIRH